MNPRNNHKAQRTRYSVGCFFLILVCIGLIIGFYYGLPQIAAASVGPSTDSLTDSQRFQYSALMLWYDGMVTNPANSKAGEIPFTIAQGDSVGSVAARLEKAGIIRSAEAFVDYLVYAGLDTSLQAGDFQLSAAMAPIQIAQKLQDATPTQVKFVILPGWRLEEVAAAMPTSGLNITPKQFIQAAQTPETNFDFLPSGANAEGFLFPGQYILPRTIEVNQLVQLFMNNASLAITSEMQASFHRQNLTVYQAVTLASIIQREAVVPEEQPTIASVFINRLEAGMPLETDPTVQYALGFNQGLNTWWKVPLSEDDLGVNSAYNTYHNRGLPPGPICSPSLSALQAVANPAQTPYLYFRARCDNSHLHSFSETYQQHLNNGCP